MSNTAMFTSNSDRWFTPSDLMAEIADFLGPDWHDPCPARLPGERIESGLWQTWKGLRVYCNPPYGRAIVPWVHKCVTEPAREVIMLIPARTETSWFQPLYEYPICFIAGRLRFSESDTNAPFPSALVYRGYRPRKFAAAFAHRGPIVRRWRP